MNLEQDRRQKLEKIFELKRGKSRNGWEKIDHYLKQQLSLTSKEGYRAGFDYIDDVQYLVIAIPWPTTIKKIRKWIQEVQKRYKNIPAGVDVKYIEKNGKIIATTVFKKPDIPFKPPGIRTKREKSMRIKRNRWIKERYRQLRKDKIAIYGYNGICEIGQAPALSNKNIATK